MHDLAVEVGTPVAVDDAEEEQARQQKEIRHAEGTRESHDLVHEAFPAHGVADAKRGMHHDDERDADALGVVEPNDAVLGRRGGSERRKRGRAEAGPQLAPRFRPGHRLGLRRSLGQG